MNNNILFSSFGSFEKFDKTDLKIIQILVLNSRVSLKKIALSVNLSKEGVRARIKSLEKKGIILGSSAVINFRKIGVSRYFFRVFLNGTIQEKDSYIEKIGKYKDIISVSSVGDEFYFLFFIKDYSHLQKIVGDVFDRKMIRDFEYFKILNYHYSPPVLFEFKGDKKLSKFFSMAVSDENIKVDNIDLGILRILSEDSRLKISDISDRLSVNRDVVKYRLKRLVKFGIFESFLIYYDVCKLGYMTHVLSIAVGDRKKLREMIYFLKNHHLTNGVVELEGVWNLYCPFYSKSIKEVVVFEKEFLSKFGESVFNYSIRSFREQKTFRNFPEAV